MLNLMEMGVVDRIKPANRIAQVEEYYFSRKLKEIARLNAEGRDIISLGIGGPDRPPHPSVLQKLSNRVLCSDVHGYQSYAGLPELRKAFAKWYHERFGVILDSNKEIQPLIGSKEGILHITMAFVNPGDAVLIPNPGYPTYAAVSRLAEAELLTYDLKEENGWYPDFEQLEQMPLERVKIMWVNYPNMPTGTPATMDLFQRLVEFGKRHQILIVNDNPYSFILNDCPISILSAEGAKDIAIEMNSLSKSHNMAGWRIGMLASNSQFVEWVLRVKSNVDSGQYRPMMEAAVEALSSGDTWYAELNGAYSNRRKIAERIMAVLGCRYDESQRGLFLWGRIPDDAISSERFADEILYNANVFLTPGFVFGSNGDRYIRISLCAAEDRMAEALNRIKNKK